jgi:hypothetical protein
MVFLAFFASAILTVRKDLQIKFNYVPMLYVMKTYITVNTHIVIFEEISRIFSNSVT